MTYLMVQLVMEKYWLSTVQDISLQSTFSMLGTKLAHFPSVVDNIIIIPVQLHVLLLMPWVGLYQNARTIKNASLL